MWHDTKNKFFGEKMLWMAVMRRAIFDYTLYQGVGAWSFDWKWAKQFVFDQGVSCEDGLTCEEVCGLFGWDVEYIRRLTRLLGRGDVRKLEASRFREEFVTDVLAVVVESFDRWSSYAGVPAPFLPNRQYSKVFRNLFLESQVTRPALMGTHPPVVSWRLAA